MKKNPYEQDEIDNTDVFFDDEALKNEEDLQQKKTEEVKPKNPYMGGSFQQNESGQREKKGNPYAMQKGEKEDGRYEMKPKKQSKVGKIVLCVLLSVVLFISGGVTGWFLLGKQTRSFLKTKFLIENFYYEEVDEDDFYDVVFDAINNDLLDPYSQYLTTDEYQDMLEGFKGSRSGLGISFLVERFEKEEKLKVVLVCGNSPAEEAGVKVGWYLTGFGESQNSTQTCTSFEQFSAFLEEYDSGEVFYIQLTEGENVMVLPIAKAEYIENYVFYRTETTAYCFTGKDATTLTEKGEALSGLDAETGYIRLTQFNGNAGIQFDKAMQQFKKDNKKHLILDLRNNGGGNMDVLCEIAKYFCKDSNAKKPLIAKSEYRDYDEKYYAPKNLYKEYFQSDSQIYVLADNSTASASEALMGCMLDYNATSYQNICLSYRDSWTEQGKTEAKTYGKGIMQMTIPLLFGSDALKITVAKIVWPTSGNCIHGRGILPSDGTKTVEENAVDDIEIKQAIAKLRNANGGTIA